MTSSLSKMHIYESSEQETTGEKEKVGDSSKILKGNLTDKRLS